MLPDLFTRDIVSGQSDVWLHQSNRALVSFVCFTFYSAQGALVASSSCPLIGQLTTDPAADWLIGSGAGTRHILDMARNINQHTSSFNPTGHLLHPSYTRLTTSSTQFSEFLDINISGYLYLDIVDILAAESLDLNDSHGTVSQRNIYIKKSR